MEVEKEKITVLDKKENESETPENKKQIKKIMWK